jgi:hypothetical protein
MYSFVKGIVSPQRKGIVVRCILFGIKTGTNFELLFYPEKRESSERIDVGSDQSKEGRVNQLKRVGCVVGVRC